MAGTLQRVILTCMWMLQILVVPAQSEGRYLLAKLKEASYYDSARFFSAAADVEKAASTDKTLLSEFYLYKGNFFFYLSRLSEARQFFEKALKESKVHNQHALQILAQVRLAYVELETGSEEKAWKDMQDLLASVKKGNDHVNTAEILNFMGLFKERKNAMQDAVKFYLEGIALAGQHGLNYYNGVFRNNLGLINYATGQTGNALSDYENGLKYAMLDHNARLASHIKMNMCIALVNQKKFAEASKLFVEVTDYSRRNNLPVELASVYINLASSYSQADQPRKAGGYIDSAIAVLKKHELRQELERAYLGKADILVAQAKWQEAAAVLAEFKLLNDQSKDLGNATTYYLMMYRLAEARKDKENALANYLTYTRLRDSLNGILNAKAIQELQVKYDVQHKEMDLERERSKSLLLEKSNQEERFMKWLIVGGSGALLALFIFGSALWYSKKLRGNQEQFSQMLIRDIEAERARIARDLHDDIGQSLSIIKSKVNQGSGNGAVGEELSRVIEQTRQISRNLYPAYLEKIGLVRALATLMEKVQAATGIECNFDVDEQIESVSIERKTHLYRIVQECVNNTIKHSGANALKVSVQKSGEDLLLNYRDNGKGMPYSRISNGLGLQSIGERVKMMGGTLGWGEKSEKGFVLNIKFQNNEEPVNS